MEIIDFLWGNSKCHQCVWFLFFQMTLFQKESIKLVFNKEIHITLAGENLGMKQGIRKCNHHCKNKEACGHDCCEFHPFFWGETFSFEDPYFVCFGSAIVKGMMKSLSCVRKCAHTFCIHVPSFTCSVKSCVGWNLNVEEFGRKHLERERCSKRLCHLKHIYCIFPYLSQAIRFWFPTIVYTLLWHSVCYGRRKDRIGL